MDLSNIFFISGKPGLYKIVAKSKRHIIVESIIDKKRFPAFASSKMVSLKNISVYTENKEIPLIEVFKKIYEKTDGQKALSHKEEASKLKDYFSKIIPDYDKERVFVSDIKKILNWFNILIEKKLLKVKEKENKGKEKTQKSPKSKDVPTNVKDKAKKQKTEKSKAKTSKVKNISKKKEKQTTASKTKKTSNTKN